MNTTWTEDRLSGLYRFVLNHASQGNSVVTRPDGGPIHRQIQEGLSLLEARGLVVRIPDVAGAEGGTAWVLPTHQVVKFADALKRTQEALRTLAHAHDLNAERITRETIGRAMKR